MSSGVLYCVPGTSLKLDRSWYFEYAKLLPKTKTFLTSALLYKKHSKPVLFYFRCYLDIMKHYKFPKEMPNNVNWMIIL